MSKPVEFDEFLDVAYAEVYRIACDMEHCKTIDPQENSTEEFCKDCKQIAADFVEAYEAACKLGEFPSFYDDLWAYAKRELVKKYPPTKTYKVTIDAKATYVLSVEATSKKEAEVAARNIIACDPSLEKRIRELGEIKDISAGGVAE